MKTLILKRKQIIIFILTLTLCAAIVINWYYTGRGNVPSGPKKSEESQNLGEAKQVSKNEKTGETSTDITYFTNAKLKRDAELDETKEMLTDIIKSKDSGEAAIADAREKLDKIIDNGKLQVDTENIIAAKLNSDCLVILGADSAEIMIPETKLDDTAAIQIKEIILSKTSLSAEKISIIGVKNVVEN
ncbi:MAG: SpoIIIAH-like family protein [Clostridiales bacterium]|nr:SpoIIIAH-like family protein [Clostridiales bacterium]